MNMDTPWRDKDLLRNALERNEGVFTDTAEDIGTSRKTVARWVDRLDIDVPEPPWVDKKELREAYHRLGSQRKVSDELGYNQRTIGEWLNEYEIEVRKGDPTRDLYDAEKMRQYYEEEQSLEGVRSRLQGSPGNGAVLKWLRKHGVDLNHDHATRGEEVEKKCSYCDKEEVVYASTATGKEWYCSTECMGKDMRAEVTPERPYRGEWLKMADEIRQRDGSCRRCRADPDETLHVHHIVPVREFETHEKAHDPDNLVALCPTCHATMERLTEAEQREII
jgi:hypothetical protein